MPTMRKDCRPPVAGCDECGERYVIGSELLGLDCYRSRLKMFGYMVKDGKTICPDCAAKLGYVKRKGSRSRKYVEYEMEENI